MYNSKKDYYKILELHSEERSSQDEIRKQYKLLALKHHPDKNKHQGSEATFKHIVEAYKCFSDSNSKARYDSERTLYLSKDKPRPSASSKTRASSNGGNAGNNNGGANATDDYYYYYDRSSIGNSHRMRFKNFHEFTFAGGNREETSQYSNSKSRPKSAFEVHREHRERTKTFHPSKKWEKCNCNSKTGNVKESSTKREPSPPTPRSSNFSGSKAYHPSAFNKDGAEPKKYGFEHDSVNRKESCFLDPILSTMPSKHSTHNLSQSDFFPEKLEDISQEPTSVFNDIANLINIIKISLASPPQMFAIESGTISSAELKIRLSQYTKSYNGFIRDLNVKFGQFQALLYKDEDNNDLSDDDVDIYEQYMNFFDSEIEINDEWNEVARKNKRFLEECNSLLKD